MNPVEALQEFWQMKVVIIVIVIILVISAQRVPEPDPLPGISFHTRPDPIQF